MKVRFSIADMIVLLMEAVKIFKYWPMLWLTLTVGGIWSVHVETRYPCAFIDTVNITGNGNGNGNDHGNYSVYIHDGKEIPPEYVAVYDFIIENGLRIPSERHLRACVCKLKPCIRFCCPTDQYYDLESHNCSSAYLQPPPQQDTMQIALSNGSVMTVSTAAHFSVYVETPCERMRTVTKGDQYVHWTLYANGTVAHYQHIFAKHYCFTPMLVEKTVWDWQPLACATEKLHFTVGVLEWTYAICLMISVICMAIVVFIYLICTEMRNTFYGVAIKAYAICVAIGYSLLAHLTLKDPTHMSKMACTQIPSVALLYLVLSFYILCFISLNLYLNFHGVILTKLMFWLIFCPIVLIVVGWCFYVAYVYHGSRPVFGGDTCWFDPRNWSIMIYFYTPIFIACAICGFIYIITLIYISERNQLVRQKSHTTLEDNRFKSFWMFYGYTLASWSVYVCTFAFNYYRGNYTHLNYVVCFFVTLHGFGALYALIGKNRQIQIFLQRIEENIDDDICENSIQMSTY